MTFGRGLRVVAFAVGTFLLTGCGEQTSYAYFGIRLTLRSEGSEAVVPREALALINGCQLLVEGADVDQVAIGRCQLGMITSHTIGDAYFSTNQRSGQVRFIFRVFDVRPQDGPFAEGTSEYYRIVPNQLTSAAVEARLVRWPSGLQPRP